MECQICFENFDATNFIPKILIQCGHSFCRICLDRLSLNSLVINCPICRERTKIVKKEYFPTNYTLLEILDKEIRNKETKNLLQKYKFFDDKNFKHLNQIIIRDNEPKKLVLKRIIQNDFIYVEEIENNQNYSIFSQFLRRNRRYSFNKDSIFRLFFNEYSYSLSVFRKSSPCKHSFSCLEHNIRKLIFSGGLSLLLKFPIKFFLNYYVSGEKEINRYTKYNQIGIFCLVSVIDIMKCLFSYCMDDILKMK